MAVTMKCFSLLLLGMVVLDASSMVVATTGRIHARSAAARKIFPSTKAINSRGGSFVSKHLALAALAAKSPDEDFQTAPTSESHRKVALPSPQTSKLGPNAPPPGFLRKLWPTFPWYRVPNMLTYMRCLSIPLLLLLFYLPNGHVASSVLFGAASYTDWLDGYLARRWDIVSSFGSFLDPLADKLIVSTSLILLSGRYGAEVALPTCIILAREIAVSGLREWMAQQSMRDVVKVGFQGKVKTAATMLSLILLLAVPPLDHPHEAFLGSLYQPGLAMLYLCAVVTVTSGSMYFRAAAPYLFKEQ